MIALYFLIEHTKQTHLDFTFLAVHYSPPRPTASLNTLYTIYYVKCDNAKNSMFFVIVKIQRFYSDFRYVYDKNKYFSL